MQNLQKIVTSFLLVALVSIMMHGMLPHVHHQHHHETDVEGIHQHDVDMTHAMGVGLGITEFFHKLKDSHAHTRHAQHIVLSVPTIKKQFIKIVVLLLLGFGLFWNLLIFFIKDSKRHIETCYVGIQDPYLNNWSHRGPPHQA
ncbi:hypothetical protein EYV94_16120 [Puteibacter caeruleilacunae]|nr:hypothetical protein EYV94_16120 [Puteibacter caeruleilacunae]